MDVQEELTNMVNIMDNTERFSKNIFLPVKKIVRYDDSEATYDLYVANFSSLYNLQQYLLGNPEINSIVFNENDLSSETGTFRFAGVPYDQAVSELLDTSDEKFKEFLKIVRTVNSATPGMSKKYNVTKSYTGSRISNTSYIMGNPKCYSKREKIIVPKFIKMSINLAYNCNHDKNQVYFRSIIISNLVKALEESGYSVNVDTFALLEEDDEMMKISIQMKSHNGKLHMSDLYKMTCNVEFFRRIIFRVMETLDVHNLSWEDGYGRTCNEELTRATLGLKKDDILFCQPSEMGIEGDDLASDFESAINHLGIEDIIDVKRAKRTLESDEVKLLLSKRMR